MLAVAAVARLGQRVWSERGDLSACHQLGDELIVDHVVEVIDNLRALVTNEAVVGEFLGAIHEVIVDANEGGPSGGSSLVALQLFAGEPNGLAMLLINSIKSVAAGWNDVRRLEFGGA